MVEKKTILPSHRMQDWKSFQKETEKKIINRYQWVKQADLCGIEICQRWKWHGTKKLKQKYKNWMCNPARKKKKTGKKNCENTKGKNIGIFLDEKTKPNYNNKTWKNKSKDIGKR